MQLNVLFLSHVLAIAIEQIQVTVLSFAYLEYKQIYILSRIDARKIIYPLLFRTERFVF